jgi:hypothetical protein
MKTTRVRLGSFFAVAALSAGLPLGAQTIQFFVVGKEQRFDQTNTATVNPRAVDVPNNQYPWRIFTDINGSGLTSTTPAALLTNVVTTPSGSSTTNYSVAWDTSGNQWKYRAGFSTQAGLDAAYANGTYGVSVNSGAGTFNLPLGATNHYPNTPIATLTGGNWVGGVYQFNPANTLTISSGTYNTDFLYSTARIEIGINGNSYNFQLDKGVGSTTPFLSTDTMGSILASLPPATFISGNTYNVDISYNYATSFADISSAFGQVANSANGVTIFGATTSFTIQAVPEPSTYAAIFGVVALAGVMIRRRRRAAA